MPKFFNQPDIPNYDMLTELSDGLELYIGWGLVGAKTTDAKWQIYKLFYDDDDNVIEQRYADGDESFNKVWNSRDAYNYTVA